MLACFIEEGVRSVYGFLSALFPPFKIFQNTLSSLYFLSFPPSFVISPPGKVHVSLLFPVEFPLLISGLFFKPSGQKSHCWHLLAFSKHFFPSLIRFLIFVMASLDPLPLVFPLVAIFFAERQIPKLARHVPRRYTATTTNYSLPDVVHA